MEREFKWSTSDSGSFIEILTSYNLPPVEQHDSIRIKARYYDTIDGMLAKLHGGLRLRRENEKSICCLKLAEKSSLGSALKSREEYECEAPDIQTGLRLLSETTEAPSDICEALRNADLSELGQMTFTRQIHTFNTGDCVAVLSFDRGAIIRGERRAPICELELEYQSGSTDAFEALGTQIQQHFHLKPEPRSKLARLLHL